MTWTCTILQVLNYISHFVAAHWLNISITKELHPSNALFVMRPKRYVGLIKIELILEIFGHGCSLASGIEYKPIPLLNGRVIEVYETP